MEKIFIYLIAGISVLAMAYAFYKIVKDAYFAVHDQKKSRQFNVHYKEMFSKYSKSAHSQNDLFDFEIIQSRSNLLKKNTGKDLCADCKRIEYVEYFYTIKY